LWSVAENKNRGWWFEDVYRLFLFIHLLVGLCWVFFDEFSVFYVVIGEGCHQRAGAEQD